MENWKFNLQMFAEDGGEQTESAATTEKQTNEPGDKPKAEPKYTDADVDKLIERKFAEWQKKKDKEVSEAERLSKMTAEEKAAERVKALEDKLHGYEVAAARADMMKQARAMLQDKSINVSDELLANLIAEDADTTKSSVENFISLFSAAVEKAVKDALKGQTPKTGATTTAYTKEQIMNISNRAERQRLMKEYAHLF